MIGTATYSTQTDTGPHEVMGKMLLEEPLGLVTQGSQL